MSSKLGVQNIAHTNGTNAMTIDSSGRVLQPTKPAFMARGFGSLHTASSLTVNSITCLLYTSPSPRDGLLSRMPSSA